MAKKFISLLLSTIMLAGALASCGDSGKAATGSPSAGRPSGAETGDSSDKTTLTEEQIQAVTSRISALKSEAGEKYNGKEFNFIGRDGDYSFPTEENLVGDEESDAVYNRNMQVERDFGIKIVNTPTEDGPTAADMVISDQQANIYTYELGFGNIWSTLNIVFNKGMVSDISNYPQIDIENPWWLGSMEDYYAIEDSLYFLSGDILPDFFNNAALVLFSKAVMKDYGITADLYSVVNEGEWTIDKMFEVASAIPGGGDVKRYGGSSYGIGSNIYFGAGYTITKFDENHTPYLDATLPQEVFDLATKVSAQLGDISVCYNGGLDELKNQDIGNDEILELFADNKMLFDFSDSRAVSSLRELDVSDFGILPMPKATAEQKSYITRASTGNAGSIYVPRTVEDPSFVGTITEAMGAYSYQYIRPTFYDARLKSKSVYDIDSKAMLDIIYETQVYDLYDLYGGGDFNTGSGELEAAISDAIFIDASNLASKYKASATLVSKLNIPNMIKQAKNISG